MDTSDNPQPEQKPDWRNMVTDEYKENAVNNGETYGDNESYDEDGIYGDGGFYGEDDASAEEPTNDPDIYDDSEVEPYGYDDSGEYDDQNMYSDDDPHEDSDYPTHERAPARLSDIATVYDRNAIKGKRWLLISMGLIILAPLSALFFLFISSSNSQLCIALYLTVAIWVTTFTSKKYLSSIYEPSEKDILVYSVANSIAPSVPFFILALWPCSGLSCIGNGLYFVIGIVVIPVMFVITKVTASAVLRQIIKEGVRNDSNLRTEVFKKEKLIDNLVNIVIILYLFFVIIAELNRILIFLRPAMIAVFIYSIVAIMKERADRNKMAKVVLCMMAPAVIDIVWCYYPLTKAFDDIMINLTHDYWLQGTLIMIVRATIAAILAKYMMKYIKSDKENKLSRVVLVVMAIIGIIIQIVAAGVAVFGWTLGKIY